MKVPADGKIFRTCLRGVMDKVNWRPDEPRLRHRNSTGFRRQSAEVVIADNEMDGQAGMAAAPFREEGQDSLRAGGGSMEEIADYD